ncbi:hypothetical protein WH52_08760 [Tenacibaculum holothuriorum]|uniref:Uncharacterized protein n=1 Tax=Tenacibaculum holothuriorum TaxID=1635173 RepID=A0A1Y2PCA2_9FLAO|nr:hypothetical protein [Tenacibaculum holothuriorum]OSY88102.1 hypothetical protein WH52_08760 [Tenacibaculum holothuriorum]
MTNKYYKYIKLFILASFSFFSYFFLSNSIFVEELQTKADTYDIRRGFTFLILTGIMKYFFLILGISSLLFLIYINLKEENNAY